MPIKAGLDGVPRVTDPSGGAAEHALPFRLPVAARAVWGLDGAFEIDLDLLGGIDRWTLALRPDGDGVLLKGHERTFGVPGFEVRGQAPPSE